MVYSLDWGLIAIKFFDAVAIMVILLKLLWYVHLMFW